MSKNGYHCELLCGHGVHVLCRALVQCVWDGVQGPEVGGHASVVRRNLPPLLHLGVGHERLGIRHLIVDSMYDILL